MYAQRSWFTGIAAALAVGLLNCASPGTRGQEEETEGTDSALASDELEAEVLVTGVPSKAPAITGVETWRLSRVVKAGSPEPFLVAIGERKGRETLDIVLGEAADGRTGVRVVSAEDDFTLDGARRDALAADLGALAARLAPAVRDPSIAPRTKTRSAEEECADAEISRTLRGGAAAFAIGATVVSCVPGFFSFGVGIPVCVGAASMIGPTLLLFAKARARVAACRARP